MGRLTYKDGRGRNTLLINGQEYHGPIADRLAAYEDTGLEPERLSKIQHVWNAFAGEEARSFFEVAEAAHEGRLVVLPFEDATRPGLKRKYFVFKAETGESVEGCFVLRPDRDPAARIALEAYARATDNKDLADDIDSWIGYSGKVKVLPVRVGDYVFYKNGPTFGDEVKAIILDPIDNQIVVNGHRSFLFSDLGREVFTTCEEAEKALEERKC